jgi:hypothetical protein
MSTCGNRAKAARHRARRGQGAVEGDSAFDGQASIS